MCGAVATGAEALGRLAEVEADIALIDVRLPGMNGIDLVEQLQARYPALRCLVLSGYRESIYIRHAFRVGARAYILKGNPPELLEAIQTVMAGGIYLSPSLQGKLPELGR